MFKSATRWAKPATHPKSLEAIIHEAEPMASYQDSFEDGMSGIEPGYWVAHPPFVNGGAMGYGSVGPYDTEAEAIEACKKIMAGNRWRASRAEAEADGLAEIEARLAALKAKKSR